MNDNYDSNWCPTCGHPRCLRCEELQAENAAQKMEIERLRDENNKLKRQLINSVSYGYKESDR